MIDACCGVSVKGVKGCFRLNTFGAAESVVPRRAYRSLLTANWHNTLTETDFIIEHFAIPVSGFMENTITKSTRHSEIVGKFGEYAVCNWLSRCGFEVCVVNHTGLDIIAYDLKSKHRLGITVKSRTRKSGKESDSVNVFKRKDREKLEIACKSFGCKPWLAIYVECGKIADMYLTSLANYDDNYKSKKAPAIETWSMNKGPRKAYASDPNVYHIHFDFNLQKWPPLH